MRLSEFILGNREPILAEWAAFARTCAPASGAMDIEALRDHADAMLTTIAADLAVEQSGLAQAEKSKGLAPGQEEVPTTAAGEHGAGRAQSGYTVDQMVAEYRALRASVIRLWTKSEGALEAADIEDLTRFNEAIDQSLAESVARFNQDVEESKETFLAILGHDLRTPLGAIRTSAVFMLETGELQEPHRALTDRMANSAKRALTMVGDLLDFTRSRLGGGIPIQRAEIDLGKVVREVVNEVGAACPDCPIRVDTRVEQRGRWDAARLSQALTNVIGNAVQHGARGTTVSVRVTGTAHEVAIAVHNRGAVISREQMDGIFNPMQTRKLPRATAMGPTGSLGLGLYIAEQIVRAHEGEIVVESTPEGGTTFTIRLPRGAPALAGASARTSAGTSTRA
jgi:signal transduction histidine kinase